MPDDLRTWLRAAADAVLGPGTPAPAPGIVLPAALLPPSFRLVPAGGGGGGGGITASLLALRLFSTPGLGIAYVPTVGTQRIVVEVLGGGGAGGGPGAAAAGQIALGVGGSAGGYAAGVLTLAALTAPFALDVGAGGAGVVGGTGGNGGDSEFRDAGGMLLRATGGGGGAAIGSGTSLQTILIDAAGVGSGPGAQWTHAGFPINFALRLSGTQGVAGSGGSTPHGAGGAGTSVTGTFTGVAASGLGAGGGGGKTQNGGAAVAGGDGAPGAVLVWEYA